MKQRLLTDLCAAIKLAACGDKLFKSGVLTSGDLILHPILFQEIKRWRPETKKTYEYEINILQAVRAAANLRLTQKELDPQLEIIEMSFSKSSLLSRADKEQLATALFHDDLSLVTNDKALFDAAESLEVVAWRAEDIICEAIENESMTVEEVQKMIEHWAKNGDFTDGRCADALRKLGIKV